MKSNIDFMKTLNETFGYMQLPLKLQNQNTHGDLYVYTKKDSLKQNRDQISLLLHLEMEYLGVLDVKLEKDKNNINANFKLDNEDSRELISRNTHILQDSLNEKGYTCQIQVQPLEQPENPVQDFLNTKVTTAATKEMKRFSFDIRA
jgi:flagellar hook-length control protein FliK